MPVVILHSALECSSQQTNHPTFTALSRGIRSNEAFYHARSEKGDWAAQIVSSVFVVAERETSDFSKSPWAVEARSHPVVAGGGAADSRIPCFADLTL